MRAPPLKTLILSLIALSCVVASRSVFAQTATAVPASYETTDLSGGWSWSRALGINARGDIVGEAFNSTTGTVRAVAWRVGAKAPGPVDLGTLGGGSSHARAIGDTGAIVGTADIDNDRTHACLWRGGTAIDLGTLGGTDSDAFAIDAAGEIVGCARTVSGTARAFLFRDGRMRELPTPGEESAAIAMSGHGVFAGYCKFSATSSCTHAVIWRDGGDLDVNPRDASASMACGLNPGGRAVGWSLLDETRAFSWSDGVYVDLGTQGAEGCKAMAINASGAIVGELRNGEERRAFVLRDGQLTRLDGIGGKGESAAYAINAAGWIVGEAFAEDDQPHAVLWRPVTPARSK